MNVKDVESIDIDPRNYLNYIFVKQRTLMDVYIEIEQNAGIGKGLLKNIKWDIDNPICQYVVKDFAWRITEEMAEAGEVVREIEKSKDLVGDELIHAKEELIDALHFYIELCILNEFPFTILTHVPAWVEKRIGFRDQLSLQTINNPLHDLFDRAELDLGNMFEPYAWQMIEFLGKTMNCLKNKPWKQSHMKTDVGRYTDLIITVFLCWIKCAKVLGLTADTTFDFYYRKSEVNMFRQRSKY